MRLPKKLLFIASSMGLQSFALAIFGEFESCNSLVNGLPLKHHPTLSKILDDIDHQNANGICQLGKDITTIDPETAMKTFQSSARICANLESWQRYKNLALGLRGICKKEKYTLDEIRQIRQMVKGLVCAKHSMMNDPVYFACRTFYEEISREYVDKNDTSVPRLIHSITELRIAGARQDEINAWAENIIMNLKQNFANEKIAEVYNAGLPPQESWDPNINPCLIKCSDNLFPEGHGFENYWKIGMLTREQILDEKVNLLLEYRLFVLDYINIPATFRNLPTVQIFNRHRRQLFSEIAFLDLSASKSSLENAKIELKYMKCANELVKMDPTLRLLSTYGDAILPIKAFSSSQEVIIEEIEKMKKADISADDLKAFTEALWVNYNKEGRALGGPMSLDNIKKAIDIVYSSDIPPSHLEISQP